ncbi:aspartyl-phosphate phosphatase Spo0E family protein [Fictibacillus nanhaiensis]|uniref:aspartyl-phosphate phosphatase Spo0E family protein n=1 Tax=Fictibacillus nanhaiensis TaxID=742169 RepID=UPI001C96A7A9|nr:aspartyl-phosphate phosphatase Spo0E family protein [Fictibacillus nanhaiensis]MBY6037818.1 aspartyl-phosphate phosphatase Spo0E family protein [Fictibacillus nanhaiensis]
MTKEEPIFVEKKEWNNSLLMECIKEKKEKLVEVADRSGLTSNETVKCSQELDVLLNVYQRQASF